MASSVDSAFSEFNKTVVNLDPDRTTKAIASRDWLYQQLNKLDTNENLEFPLLYSDRHIKFGSFARKTKIRELDDVDLMLCLKADGATYSVYKDIYTIHTPDAGQRLQNLSEENILNSRRVVNKLRDSLSKVEQYKAAELHSRGEAATLSLQSYEWVFDIVPCFYTDTQHYLIPNGSGNWKASDPRVDQRSVTDANLKYEGKVLQFIRVLKYWNRHNSTFTVPSYLFEQLVINYVNTKSSLNDYMDFEIRDFYFYLKDAIFNSVMDPKGFQGDLNNLDFMVKSSISDKANWAHGKAQDAINAEVSDHDQEKAITIWRQIFGDRFPKYE